MGYCLFRYAFSRHSLVLALITGLMLAGCAVGPDFKRPDAPQAKAYTAGSMPEKTAEAPVAGGASQHFIPGQDIPAQWWTLFHSEPLDKLIRQALANSPTLAAARASLRQAEENRRALFGALLPSVDANVSVSREKISGASQGEPDLNLPAFSLHNASVTVSYALDIFGGTRRQLEALESLVDYQRFQLEGAHLTLASNVVTAAIRESSLQSQIKATQEILASQEQQLAIVEKQFQLGAVSGSDVLTQRTQVAQTRAMLPPLENQLSQTRHSLAALTGGFPSETPLPEFNIENLTLPENLPVSLPSSLVSQRPDILASEALMHEASAQVGVATANLYPQVTLSGSYGTQAASMNRMFSANSAAWDIGAGLLQPLFRGGALTAERRAAIAAYDQARANYQETVLQAFQNVADVLRALETDAVALKAQKDAETAARESLELTQDQFKLGAISYLSLLIAERLYQQTRINLIQAQASRFADTAALFQALGGGWWNRRSEDRQQQNKHTGK